MIRIDDSLLEELGLIALPKADRDQLLKQIYETLEMKVGMRLAERMTDQQLDEFERFIDTNDEAGALKWLETNFPDYKQVVADELEKLKVEIKKDSPKIIEALRANPAPAPQPPTGQGQFAAPPAPQYAVPAQQPGAIPAAPAQPAPHQFAPAPQPPQPSMSPAMPINDPSAPAPQPPAQPWSPPPPTPNPDPQQFGTTPTPPATQPSPDQMPGGPTPPAA